MRRALIASLTSLAARDPRPLLLTADLGFTVVEPFAAAFPDRFINVGVAEQNMIGIATGLADAGFMPFCYSIAPFATLRPYEFIRNGPVAHALPVRIIGVGAGFDYGTAGPTHHALEDIAVMRAMPGMTIVAPADSAQTTAALESTWSLPGPVYYRLGKEGPALAELHGSFTLGRADWLRSGDDLLLISTGRLVSETLAAASTLAESDIEATVMAVPCFAPAPVADLVVALTRAPAVITVEAHQSVGGLGSLVAEVLAEAGLARPFRRLSAAGIDVGRTGGAPWMLKQNGLTLEGIVCAARGLLGAGGA